MTPRLEHGLFSLRRERLLWHTLMVSEEAWVSPLCHLTTIHHFHQGPPSAEWTPVKRVIQNSWPISIKIIHDWFLILWFIRILFLSGLKESAKSKDIIIHPAIYDFLALSIQLDRSISVWKQHGKYLVKSTSSQYPQVSLNQKYQT